MSGTIQRLDETVVNRIAAGEVIHRPSNALKEIMENSLDAGSTSISVQAKAGGTKLLQIADNGSGIKRSDLDIVCERFTTSKLQKFEDLETISTFGFRGEALASISHVSHLTITSRTKENPCAFKAKYIDGKLAPFTPNGPTKPKACAGTIGTQITVEDLFYNVLTRKRALRNPSDEYNKIISVVTRYALHYPHVAFSCKKYGENAADVQTPGASAIETFKVLFGNALAREIIEFETKDEKLSFSMKAMITNPNYNAKKATFILFINNRLVESAGIKKGLQETYSTFLPKHTHPFIYLAIAVKPQHIDVNVHPTKNEVHILNEDDIIVAIQKMVEEKLMACNSSRTFEVQQPSTNSFTSHSNRTPSVAPAPTVSRSVYPSTNNTSVAPQNRVRTDQHTQTLNAFFEDSPTPRSQPEYQARMVQHEVNSIPLTAAPNTMTGMIYNEEEDAIEFSQPQQQETPTTELTKRVSRPIDPEDDENDFQQTQPKKQATNKPVKPVLLTSIRNLLTETEGAAHKGLSELFHNFTFVGCVDCNFALVQYKTKLYLISVKKVSEQLFYQEALRKFSNFPVIRLSTPANIEQLIDISMELEPPKEGSQVESSTEQALYLISFAAMLEEYFSITVSPEGELITLPQLIPKYIPPLENLPTFLRNLCTKVDWTDEQACFKGIAEQLAIFYQFDTITDLEQAENPNYLDLKNHSSPVWKIEHLLFPALRTDFTAHKELGGDGSVVQIACVEKLYKIFERC